MYRIEETHDLDLCRKGLHWKVAGEDFSGRSFVVAYFLDHGNAEMVRDALNALATIDAPADDEEFVMLGPVS